MKKSILKYILLANFFLFQSFFIICSLSQQPKDAYQNIRYSKAFDQEAIYEKNKSLLEKLGCARNVFPDYQIGHTVVEIPDDNDAEMTDKESDSVRLLTARSQSLTARQELLDQELKNFEQECLKPLYQARVMALAEPGLYAAAEIALTTGGALTTAQVVGKESMGGSFAMFAAAMDAFRLAPGIIRSAYHLYSRPDNILENLENQFAKNKCFIPNALWPKIIKSFVSARQNEFSREEYISFLNNALAFTIYKPKPIIKFKDNMTVSDLKKELNSRIDAFFSKYIRDASVAKSLSYIKINIFKFIDSLINHGVEAAPLEAPRYLYLHGLGGIGKTHFVQTMAGWINELIPDSVCFEELVIHSADELEGTTVRPGAMLGVLRNQLNQNKRGSIVMIDEATWLNEPGMVSAAKRIFNNDQSKLSTPYFGTDVNGANLNLTIPPMLIVVASNEAIQDPALESRFDVITYPAPSQEALVEYAIKKAKNSTILKDANISIDPALITSWVNTLTLAEKNFRYINGNIETFLLSQK